MAELVPRFAKYILIDHTGETVFPDDRWHGVKLSEGERFMYGPTAPILRKIAEAGAAIEWAKDIAQQMTNNATTDDVAEHYDAINERLLSTANDLKAAQLDIARDALGPSTT